MLLFETDYNLIDINNIKIIKTTDASLSFGDGINIYSYNFSKSTLFRKFAIPSNVFRLPVEIIEDPYSIILDIFEENKEKIIAPKIPIKGEDYVILPLYGLKKGREKFVFERSGLNQWNSGGRKRDFGEVYIPIPKEIHTKYPNFFPKRYEDFSLQIPTGEIYSASVCQDDSKALMTNPNKALANWLLRKLIQLEEGELATIEKLEELGFDSVSITKTEGNIYKIDKAHWDGYESFILETL